MPLKKQNAKTQELGDIFFTALTSYAPNLKPEDVIVTSVEFDDSEVTQEDIDRHQFHMSVLGLNDRVNFHAMTQVEFPTIKDYDLIRALKASANAITGHFVSYSSTSIEIRADLNTAAEALDDDVLLAEMLASYKSMYAMGME